MAAGRVPVTLEMALGAISHTTEMLAQQQSQLLGHEARQNDTGREGRPSPGTADTDRSIPTALSTVHAGETEPQRGLRAGGSAGRSQNPRTQFGGRKLSRIRGSTSLVWPVGTQGLTFERCNVGCSAGWGHCAPWERMAMSADTLGCHNLGATGTSWVEARDTTQYPSKAPTTKNYRAPNVNGPQVRRSLADHRRALGLCVRNPLLMTAVISESYFDTLSAPS